MASAGLRAELECPICMETYKDPVTLTCGHNYCRVCIIRVLDTQEPGGYSCPECRTTFQDRPTLKKNITLCNIVENFLSAQPGQEESPEHVLTEPTTSLQGRKCSTHGVLIKYYCIDDGSCLCASCDLAVEHRGHQVETLGEASEKKKVKLRNVKEKILLKRGKTEERVQSLQENVDEAAGDTERFVAQFEELSKGLKDLEKNVLSEISQRVSSKLDMIQELEIKKDELSSKMIRIEEVCKMTDPLTVLEEPDTGAMCDAEDGDDEDRDRHDKHLHDGGGLDVGRISQILHAGLSDITTKVNENISRQDILMDVNTACYKLQISDDGKTVTRSDRDQNRPQTPERFLEYPQVLSTRSFSSGRHYWEVDVQGSDYWRVGLCYPNIDRKGIPAGIGKNRKSWGLYGAEKKHYLAHDKKEITLRSNLITRVRVDLDYEAGRISFNDQCGHLHTFTTTFTEPLRFIICVVRGVLKIEEGKF